MTATCASCGAPLSGRARFCNNCGAPAAGPAVAATTAQPQAEATVPLMEVRISILRYLVRPRIWGVWVVLVAIIVGWVYFNLPIIGVGVLALITLLFCAYWWVVYRTNRMVIYPDRVVTFEGILNRTEHTDPMWRIQDVTLIKKWYGLGYVRFETAGESGGESGFGPITNAQQVRDTIYRLIHQHGDR